MKWLWGSSVLGHLCFASAAIGLAVGLIAAATGTTLWLAAGVGLGLWLAAGYLWLTDPETEIPQVYPGFTSWPF